MADNNEGSNVNPELVETLTELTKRMQSGVASCEQADWEQAGIHPVLASDLKHLRVGINAAMTETAALADLLIERGLITGDDYIRACIKRMQEEVASYEERLRRRYPGVTITLGPAGAFTPGEDSNVSNN